ncbi:MAG: hypothetical protein J6K42_01760 [Clostridia bacterium]|nr:hypothetical protein [Clostridia bacterium]
MNLSMIKKDFSKFNIDKVKEILNEIESALKQNVGIIFKLLNEDNKTFAENLTYTKILEIIQNVINEPWELEKNSKNLKVDGLGNIAVVYNGSPDILLYLSIKALKTHNNIVFYEDTKIHKFSTYIINLINTISNKKNYKTTITIKQIKNFNEIYADEKDFDNYICIGEIRRFNLLKRNITKKIIYNAYGTVSLYLDDKNLKNVLLEMDEFIFKNNIALNLYKDKNIEEVITEINKKGEDFCSVIFTKDVKKAYYFLENVNSKMVYINKNPFDNYKFFIDDKIITKEKIIIM